MNNDKELLLSRKEYLINLLVEKEGVTKEQAEILFMSTITATEKKTRNKVAKATLVFSKRRWKNSEIDDELYICPNTAEEVNIKNGPTWLLKMGKDITKSSFSVSECIKYSYKGQRVSTNNIPVRVKNLFEFYIKANIKPYGSFINITTQPQEGYESALDVFSKLTTL